MDAARADARSSLLRWTWRRLTWTALRRADIRMSAAVHLPHASEAAVSYSRQNGLPLHLQQDLKRPDRNTRRHGDQRHDVWCAKAGREEPTTRLERPRHHSLPLAAAENNFVGKQTLLSWINGALQLRVERVEDVSAPPAGPPALAVAGWQTPGQILHVCASSNICAVGCAPSQEQPMPITPLPLCPPCTAAADVQRGGGVPADGRASPRRDQHEQGGLQPQKRLRVCAQLQGAAEGVHRVPHRQGVHACVFVWGGVADQRFAACLGLRCCAGTVRLLRAAAVQVR